MATHTERQPIALSLVKDPPCPEHDESLLDAAATEGSDVDKLLKAFTAARVARANLVACKTADTTVAYPLITIWAGVYSRGTVDVELTARLYASALAPEGVTLAPHVSLYADGMQIRTLQLADKNGRFADIQWPLEKQPVEGDASTAWSPSQQERQ